MKYLYGVCRKYRLNASEDKQAKAETSSGDGLVPRNRGENTVDASFRACSKSGEKNHSELL